MDIYEILPYHYRLDETFPVMRIPVTGPDPYNTLIVVRGMVPVQLYGVADGDLRRRTLSMDTGPVLLGHDRRASTPPFQQSSTAAIHRMQASNDTQFIQAIDAISGAFDDNGHWIVKFSIAYSSEDVFCDCVGYFSSWILCYEPPL